jgi:hypothetical protein
MSPEDRRRSARTLAAQRKLALRRRARRIRRSVAAITVAVFLVAFVGIYVQLASGHDPALTANEKKRSSAALAAAGESSAPVSTSSSGASPSATGEASESGSASGESSSSASESTSSDSESSAGESSGPSSVTTSQS